MLPARDNESTLVFQIEDLSQQSAVRAVNQFKTPEAGPAGSDLPSATQATIQEESDQDDEEVRTDRACVTPNPSVPAVIAL